LPYAFKCASICVSNNNYIHEHKKKPDDNSPGLIVFSKSL